MGGGGGGGVGGGGEEKRRRGRTVKGGAGTGGGGCVVKTTSTPNCHSHTHVSFTPHAQPPKMKRGSNDKKCSKSTSSRISKLLHLSINNANHSTKKKKGYNGSFNFTTID